ncbi:MAG: SCP2 sterol-binding domain-containing protein, partial [Dehalococcoidia bacterium]
VGLVPRWLTSAFQPGLGIATPIRYRFDVPGPVVVRQDVLVNHDSFELQPAGDARPDVTFHCNTGNYLLVIYGRLSSDWGAIQGRLAIEGRREQATVFSTWFRGF